MGVEPTTTCLPSTHPTTGISTAKSAAAENRTPIIGEAHRARHHLDGRDGSPRRVTERIDGIEPTSTGWKPVALPLSYIRGWWSRGDLHPHRLSAKQVLSCLSYDPF